MQTDDGNSNVCVTVKLVHAMRKKILAVTLEAETLELQKLELEKDVDSLGKFVMMLKSRNKEMEAMLTHELSHKVERDQMLIKAIEKAEFEKKARQFIEFSLKVVQEKAIEYLDTAEYTYTEKLNQLDDRVQQVCSCANILHIRFNETQEKDYQKNDQISEMLSFQNNAAEQVLSILTHLDRSHNYRRDDLDPLSAFFHYTKAAADLSSKLVSALQSASYSATSFQSENSALQKELSNLRSMIDAKEELLRSSRDTISQLRSVISLSDAKQQASSRRLSDAMADIAALKHDQQTANDATTAANDKASVCDQRVADVEAKCEARLTAMQTEVGGMEDKWNDEREKLEVRLERAKKSRERVLDVVGRVGKEIAKSLRMLKGEVAEVREEVQDYGLDIERVKELLMSKLRRFSRRLMRFGSIKASQEEKEKFEMIELELKEELTLQRQKNLRQARQLEDMLYMLEQKEDTMKGILEPSRTYSIGATQFREGYKPLSSIQKQKYLSHEEDYHVKNPINYTRNRNLQASAEDKQSNRLAYIPQYSSPANQTQTPAKLREVEDKFKNELDDILQS